MRSESTMTLAVLSVPSCFLTLRKHNEHSVSTMRVAKLSHRAFLTLGKHDDTIDELIIVLFEQPP
jgi:predicted membrane-bound spermidine synthase